MNLILINGQLKYCKNTIFYWKELALKNNADIMFVCQPKVQYKNGTEENVSVPWIKKNIPTASIFLIEDNIHKIIKNQVRLLFDSILKHNRIYNANHDLNRYSGLVYLERCFYRQLSTLYAFDHMIPKDKLLSYDRILYARSDFLLGINPLHTAFVNGGLYETSTVSGADETICNQTVGIPCLLQERNFSVSDYMYWCEYSILYNYLSAYIANFYKFQWPNNKVENSVEAQANQTRRFVNQSLPQPKKLFDIYDYPNHLYSCNYFYHVQKKKLMIRIWRFKTEQSFQNLRREEPSSSNPSSAIHRHEMLEESLSITDKGKNAFELFCMGKRDRIEAILQAFPTIIKLDMNHFLLEQRSIGHDRINATHFRNVVEYTLFLMEMKEKYPKTLFMIHMIDMHRVNWELFFYYMKILEIRHVFVMYAPWFVRSIFRQYQFKDYRKEKQNQDILQKFDSKSFLYSFYPKYLWKTRGILKSLQKKVNVFSVEKEYDILFYGCTHAPMNPDSFSKNILQNNKHIDFEVAYPFRKRLLDLLHCDDFSPLRIRIVDWLPKTDPKGVYDEKLFELISKSKFTIATTSSLQYLLRKYYEIPMAGSIIIGNCPDYAPSIYKKNMVWIQMKMNDNELVQTILSAVKNYESHTHKHSLGKTLQDISSLYETETKFMEDYIYFTRSKIKTERLSKFFDLYGWTELENLSSSYENDF